MTSILRVIAPLALLIVGCGGPTEQSASPSLIATRTESPSASALPLLDMPGSRSSPAGEYGWTGTPGERTWMHHVFGDNVVYRMTQMVFAVENDCFAGEGSEPVSVTVAGIDGLYVEPYDSPVFPFMPGLEEGQTMGAYALPMDDRTLCVYLTWDASTTPDELDAARQVVESIRGQAYGSGIRIVFTLPRGWDTG
jgi:hypothetical protein